MSKTKFVVLATAFTLVLSPILSTAKVLAASSDELAENERNREERIYEEVSNETEIDSGEVDSEEVDAVANILEGLRF